MGIIKIFYKKNTDKTMKKRKYWGRPKTIKEKVSYLLWLQAAMGYGDDMGNKVDEILYYLHSQYEQRDKVHE